jgi:hypothetical protein
MSFVSDAREEEELGGVDGAAAYDDLGAAGYDLRLIICLMHLIPSRKISTNFTIEF